MANQFYLWQKILSRFRLWKSETQQEPKIKKSFAFIIHPRNPSDASRKYSWLKALPFPAINLICRYTPPLVASEITGVRSYNTEEPIKGWLLICPLTAQQLVNNRELGKQRIKTTISLAEKLGAQIVGVGALASSITRGGLDLIDEIKIGITNGRTFTVGISLMGIKEISKIKNINLTEITMAVVGATGVNGEAMSKLFINEGVTKFILVAKNLEELAQLKREMLEINSQLLIEISTEIRSVKNAEIVVVATSSPEILIKSEDLKYGAIIYDITQPQNTSPDLAFKRKDLLIIDGGLVRTPRIDYHFDLGLSPETAFACLAETMLLAAEGKFDTRLVGKIQLEKVKEMLTIAEKYNFTHAPFQSFGKPISLK